jgi:hypothetical protein
MTTPARVPRRRHGPKPGAKFKRYPELSQLSARERRLALVLAEIYSSPQHAREEKQPVAVR